MSKLNVTVSQKTSEGQEYFEGVVSISKLAPTKIVRSDGTTRFTNRSALTSAAKAIAKSLSLEVEFVEPTRKAAKKSSKKTTSSS